LTVSRKVFLEASREKLEQSELLGEERETENRASIDRFKKSLSRGQQGEM
jgi:hypothetical protein